jgi:hypothetical protein
MSALQAGKPNAAYFSRSRHSAFVVLRQFEFFSPAKISPRLRAPGSTGRLFRAVRESSEPQSSAEWSPESKRKYAALGWKACSTGNQLRVTGSDG